MHISILTLFPDMFTSPFSQSIVGRAVKKGIVSIRYINIRDFADDAYKTVDDHPYGGGVGMILKVDVADRAIAYAKSLHPDARTVTILLDPKGKPYKQADAFSLSKTDHLIVFCAHYEGIDERIRTLVDRVYSLGDYIVTGGELPAMVVIDSTIRLIHGALGKSESAIGESFTDPHMLEEPHYTSPRSYKGMDVPEVLLSGNHADIKLWRLSQSRNETQKNRPDLMAEE